MHAEISPMDTASTSLLGKIYRQEFGQQSPHFYKDFLATWRIMLAWGGSVMAKKMNWSIALSCLVALGVAAILIITPVKRGMFFREDYLPFFTKASWFFIAVAVILVIQRHNIWQPMPDLALLAVVALYGLTILWAKNKGAAIDGALKYCVYLGVFLSAKYTSKERASNTLLRWSIVASGVVAAMVGLLSAAGVISYKDAVVGGRIFGSFQYPNALAAYQMFVCFMLLHAWYETEKLKQPWARWLGQVLFSLSGFIVLLVIVLSYSRATWIIFAAALVGYFAMLPPGARGGIFLRFTTALVPVLIVNVPMAAAIPAKEHAVVQKYMLTGAAICLGAEIARALLTSLAQSRQPRAITENKQTAPTRKAKAKAGSTKSGRAHTEAVEASKPVTGLLRVPAILAIVVVVGLVLGFTTQTGQKILSKVIPETVIRRFKSITLTDRSLVIRFFATKDAFLIAKDNPLGTGAGGWNVLYHRYQTILYWFTETHNHFAQVLVEAGFPGLIAYAIFWLSTFWMAFKAWRVSKSAEEGKSHISDTLTSELVSTGFGVLALVIHSSADFDLSLPAIAMALFAAAGSLVGSSRTVLYAGGRVDPTPGGPKDSKPVSTWKFMGKDTRALEWRHLLDAFSLVVLAVIIMVPAGKYYKGMAYGSIGVQEFYKRNEHDGQDFMYKAINYDPHTSTYAMDIAVSYFREYKETQNPGTAKLAKTLLEFARRQNPYNLADRVAEFELLFSAGLYDDATDVAYEITEMIPLDIKSYEHLALSAKEAMMTHGALVLSQGIQDQSKQEHTDAVRRYADLIKEIPARLERQKVGITGVYAQMWNPKQLDVTQPIALALGQVHFLEGNFEACVENLTLASKKADLENQAGTWLRALAMATQTNVALPEGAEPNEGEAQAAAIMYGLLSR